MAHLWANQSHCLSETCYLKIFGNSIINNKIGIYLQPVVPVGEALNDTVIYITTENWWGSADSMEIISKVHNSETGIVNFNNWLIEEVIIPSGIPTDGILQNNIHDNNEWNIYVVQDPSNIKEEGMTLDQKINYCISQNYYLS